MVTLSFIAILHGPPPTAPQQQQQQQHTSHKMSRNLEHTRARVYFFPYRRYTVDIHICKSYGEKFSSCWISHEITLIILGDLLAKIDGETLMRSPEPPQSTELPQLNKIVTCFKVKGIRFLNFQHEHEHFSIIHTGQPLEKLLFFLTQFD